MYFSQFMSVWNLRIVKNLLAAPTSSSAHQSLWTEILCYTLFGFIATVNIRPQTEVNNRWSYIWI